MFNSDTVVGEISDPQGRLRLGSVGDTECVYFHYKSTDGRREFFIVYTARELSGLLASVKKAHEMAPTLKPRSTIRLSAQPPKPIRLQVVLVAPENKSPLIILRFQGIGWKQDIFSQPETLLELIQSAERRAPMPGIVGILDRFGSNTWMIEGQTLEVSDEFSHGTGYFREYMNHAEVPEGVVVRAFPVSLNNKMHVACFEYAQGWEPSAKVDLPQGQSGDQALSDGLVRNSREIHALLSKTMFESKRVDPVWSGKVTLSSMVGDIMMTDDRTGLATWSGSGGNPVLKAGIESLRAGNLSPHDLALYALISAYYQAQNEDTEAALRDVDASMAKAWNYARFNAPELKRLVLCDWYLLVKKISKVDSGPPFAAWQAVRSEFESFLKPTVFCLPPSYPWVKSWPEAKTSDPIPAPVAEPPEEPVVSKTPLPVLPEIPASANTDTSVITPQPEAAPWSDEMMAVEDEVMAANNAPRTGKKKSPLPMLMVGLLVLGAPAAYYVMSQNSGPVQASPSPSASASASAVAPPVTPSASPDSAQTPIPSLSETPQPIASATPDTTSNVPLTGALPPGELLINGFSFDKKLREQDIYSAGYEPVDRFTEKDKGIARYQGPDGEVIVSFKLPSREITAIQGDRLTLNGQTVANLESSPDIFKDDERFSKYKLQAVVDDENKVRAFTLALDGIYLAEPLVGSPKKALEYSRKIKNKKFFETLPDEVANMRLTDGTTLIFQYLGSFETDRLEYLVKQGADPNAKSWSGETPLHATKNVKTAQALIQLGANLNAINSSAQTPYEAATSEELKAVLDPGLEVATPSPTPAEPEESSPSASPSPSPTTSPE